MSNKIDVANRATATSNTYGWTVSGPAGHELAFKSVNGTSVQMYVVNDADLVAKVNVYENWSGDLGLPAKR